MIDEVLTMEDLRPGDRIKRVSGPKDIVGTIFEIIELRGYTVLAMIDPLSYKGKNLDPEYPVSITAELIEEYIKL